MWMEDSARQRKSLTDLLCGIEEDDDSVQGKRFPQVVALDDIITAPLEVLLRDFDQADSCCQFTFVVKICSSLRWTIVPRAWWP